MLPLSASLALTSLQLSSQYCRTKEGGKIVAKAKKSGLPISTAVAYVGGGFYDIATIEISVTPENHFTYKTTDVEGGDIGGEVRSEKAVRTSWRRWSSVAALSDPISSLASTVAGPNH